MGPVVLVTGCSQGGLGYSLCEEFAAKGCKVYAGVRRPGSAEGLKSLGVVVILLDVKDANSRQDAIETIISQEGRLDILVNNAASMGKVAALMDVGEDDMEDVMRTNVLGPLALIKLATPPMARQNKGCIVNVSSLAAFAPSPWTAVYGGSKSALSHLCDCLRLELRPLGINVMQVALGGVKTPALVRCRDSMLDWPNNSLYLPAQQHAHSKMTAMHETAASPAIVAKTIVAAALKPKPPKCLWTGSLWWVGWAFRFLPLCLLEWMANAMYRLPEFVKPPAPQLQVAEVASA